VRIASALMAICCCLSSSAASAVRPDFDSGNAVRRIRAAHSTPRILDPSNPGFDDGEFLIDTSITLVPAPDNQAEPAVAFDGANFLVVWTDGRSGSCIYAARVTPQGEVLEPTGIVISQGAGGRRFPAVDFDGANFFVVWADERSGDWDIIGTRVTPQGEVLDTSGLVIVEGSYDQYAPAIAFDGTNFLVTWEAWHAHGEHNWDICGARVTPQGTVLDSAGITISQAADDQYYTSVAFDGTNFLVAWGDERSGSSDIYGARVTPQGSVLDSAGIAVTRAANDQGYPAVVFDGANFLVAWCDYRGGSQSDIYGARVTPQGTVLDSAGLAISRAACDQDFPALAFDGENSIVVWRDYRDATDRNVYGARVTPQGTVLDSAGLVISQAAPNQHFPAAGFDGANFLLAWQDDRGGDWDICGARVMPQGEVLDSADIAVSQAVHSQYSPVTGFDGADYLVVWEDSRSDAQCDIYGARVTPQGEVLDPAGFVISQAPRYQNSPALAFDGANFLAVWQDYRGGEWKVYGSRVTPQGTVLDPTGITISQAAYDQFAASVGFDGANFLVAWLDLRSGSESDIYGARVTPAGVVLDPSGIPISTAADWQETPSIAFDGANFLVVWEDYRNGSDYDIYGARVTPQGTVLDTGGFVISDAADMQGAPALGFDGANFLVVWKDRRSGNADDIYGARVTPAGVVLDSSGIPISMGSGERDNPSLGFDGADFLVVWEDYRSGSERDVYGARVTPGGTVFDGGPIVSKQGNQSCPRLSYGAGGQTFLVYQSWAGNVGGKDYGAYRIRGKMDQITGVAEMMKPEVRMANSGATVVRGVLFLPTSASPKPQAASLLDISGRKVMDLHPGANDIRTLAPGVYFVREESQAASLKQQAIRKVVVTR